MIDGKNQVRIQLPIVWEERSNHYVFHAEGFDPSIEQDDNDDTTTFIKGNNHDEDFYHLCVEKLKHKWKQNSTDAFTHFIKKFAPNTADLYAPIFSLLVEDVRVISSLRYHDVDLSEEAIPSEMIKVCINM